MNARSIAVLIFLSLLNSVGAGTVLDFWHSYTPPQTGQKHYGFHLSSFKRGLFFGSCGISTKSQRWAFNVDLTGDGPIYPKEKVTLANDDAKPLTIVSGQITIDPKQTFATIALKVEQSGATNDFIGNGKYRIEKFK